MTMKQPRPRPDSSTALLAWTMLPCLPLALTTRAPAAVDNQTGEQIYQQQCLSCHGKQGEGSKTYGHPLEGDRSVGQLAKYIAKSMPDDDPGTCEGEDAQKVAAYIHDAFYTEDRQLLEEHATFLREMEQELKEAGKDPIGHAVPEIEPGVKEENDNIPRISNMQIELDSAELRRRFRPYRHAPVHQLGWRGKDALDRGQRGASRAVASPGEQQGIGGEADEDQQHELAPVTLLQSPVLSVLQLTNSLRGYDQRTAAPAGSFAVFGGGDKPPLRSFLRPCKFDFIRSPSRDRHIGGGESL